MRAVQLPAPHQLQVADVPDPAPGDGEVVIEVRAAALNHRDVWIKAGQYAGLKWPCIPGSDGTGTVAAMGSGVDPAWRGRDVIVNPSLDWGPREAAQGAQFQILGLPRDGTLAQRLVVPAAQLTPKPPHLSWEDAAALPLAGLTAYRAVDARAQVRPGERVLISGVGGGVALFALQLAVAAQAEVWVTSSSPDKIARAQEFGAKGGFLYTDPAWTSAAQKSPGLFDVIIDSAGGEGFSQLLDVVAPGGRIVSYGATRGEARLPLRKVFWRQVSLLGTTMGSPADWDGLINLVTRRKLCPVVSATFPLERAAEAFALMEAGGQFGKIVVTMTG